MINDAFPNHLVVSAFVFPIFCEGDPRESLMKNEAV